MYSRDQILYCRYFQVIEDMKREMETREHQRQQEQPKFEDLFEPTLEEVDDEIEDELRPGRPKLKRPSPGDSRRASAGAVVSEDFDQGRDFSCSGKELD